MNRTQLINSLIKEHGFKYYLEIGLGNGKNFANIECENKAGIDPEWTLTKFSHLRCRGHFGNVDSDT